MRRWVKPAALIAAKVVSTSVSLLRKGSQYALVPEKALDTISI